MNEYERYVPEPDLFMLRNGVLLTYEGWLIDVIEDENKQKRHLKYQRLMRQLHG